MNSDQLQELLLEKYNEISEYLNVYGFSPMDKDDVLQDTFVAAYRRIDCLREVDKMELWLKKIAMHVALRHMKKMQKRAVPSEHIFMLLDQDGNSGNANLSRDICDLLQEEEKNRELREILERIPECYETVIRLYYIQEYSLKEVAVIMNINYNTAKTLHTRALKKLRRLCKKEGRKD